MSDRLPKPSGDVAQPVEVPAGGSPLRDHPLRNALTNEVHARPFARLTAPAHATHLAMMSGEAAADSDRHHVARLCENFGVAPPDAADSHFMVDLGAFVLKWERHTEFSSYLFLQSGPVFSGTDTPFERPVLDQVPRDWLAALPGELLVGLHVELEPRDAPERDPQALSALFARDNIAGARLAGGAATAWMDFAVNPDGFGHILIRDHQLSPGQAGRYLQRLVEIETYRVLALLAFPMARRYGGDLTRAGESLTEITSRIGSIEALEDERRLLAELTALSAEVERISAATTYRFGAARAYYALVQKRTEELREGRIEGTQTIGEFLDRRLAPAMRTCEAVVDRLDLLSKRLARAAQLLRTRVDIQLEAQNSALLRSMDRRARLQLRLQETVEGLSVAAITYYAASLVNYLARAAERFGIPVDPYLATGISIPVIALLVWAGVRRVRRRLSRASESEPD